MDESLKRMAPLAGLAGIILLVVGILAAMGGSPGFAGEAEEVANYYEDEYGSILMGSFFAALAAPLLIWFLACLRTAIAGVESRDRLASTAYGAGIAMVTLLLAGLMINTMGSIRAEQDGQLAPEAAILYFDIANILFGAAAPAAFAATLLATAVAAFRYGAILPSWLAKASVVLAIVCVIPPAAWVGILVGLIWIAIVSAHLYMQQVAAES